jgi:hypothetical protein
MNLFTIYIINSIYTAFVIDGDAFVFISSLIFSSLNLFDSNAMKIGIFMRTSSLLPVLILINSLCAVTHAVK